MEQSKENSFNDSQNKSNDKVEDDSEIPEWIVKHLNDSELIIAHSSKSLYWFSVVIVGTFVWLIGSFDKFIVDGILPLKWLYIIAALLLGFSVIVIGIKAMIVWILRYGLDDFMLDIHLYGRKLAPEQMRIAREKARRYSSAFKDYGDITNNLDYAYVISYVLGLLLITIYVLVFIIYYL